MRPVKVKHTLTHTQIFDLIITYYVVYLYCLFESLLCSFNKTHEVN